MKYISSNVMPNGEVLEAKIVRVEGFGERVGLLIYIKWSKAASDRIDL